MKPSEILAERGRAIGTMEDSQGRVCALGAIRADTSLSRDERSSFAHHLAERIAPNVRSSHRAEWYAIIARWNDSIPPTPEGDAQVIAVMREVGL